MNNTYEFPISLDAIDTMTLKSLKEVFYVSDRNKKLQSDEHVLFLIWNIPAIVTCPYRTAHCEAACYAVKAEKQYPDVIPCRTRNFEFSRTEYFVPAMIRFITLKLKGLKKGRKIFFRIHESGDFYNVFYAAKWVEIAKHFSNDDRIVFLAYTKSIVMFDKMDVPTNMIIRSSLWDDTKAELVEYTNAHDMPIYTAADADVVAQMVKAGWFKCECENCATCRACYSSLIKKIVCVIH